MCLCVCLSVCMDGFKATFSISRLVEFFAVLCSVNEGLWIVINNTHVCKCETQFALNAGTHKTFDPFINRNYKSPVITHTHTYTHMMTLTHVYLVSSATLYGLCTLVWSAHPARNSSPSLRRLTLGFRSEFVPIMPRSAHYYNLHQSVVVLTVDINVTSNQTNRHCISRCTTCC